MVIWPQIAGFLLVGYLCMSRSFAYLGVAPLFIGEIVLGAFLLLKPRVALGTWAASLLRASPLNELGFALLVFLAYGIWQVGRGILGGSPIVYTLKFFVFNYYALYIFLGIWIGLRAHEHLPKMIRAIAWVNGVYGLMYIVALRHIAVNVPGSEIPLFGVPAGGAVAIVGLLCFERDLRAVWLVLVLNMLVILAWQVRAEWFGLGVGILIWGLLTGRAGRVVAIGMAGLVVLGMIQLADIRLAGRQSGVLTLGDPGSRHRPRQSRAGEATEPKCRAPRQYRGLAGVVVGADLAVRALQADAAGVRAWLWLRPVQPRAGADPGDRRRSGDPNAAQCFLLCARLYRVGRGHPVRSLATRHSQASLAILSGQRPGGRGRLLGHDHGDGLLRGELRHAVPRHPVLLVGRNGRCAGLAVEGAATGAFCPAAGPGSVAAWNAGTPPANGRGHAMTIATSTATVARTVDSATRRTARRRSTPVALAHTWRTKMRTILLRSLVHGSLLVASVLVALVVCEISLRILNVSYPVFDDYDATRGFRLRPGKQGWYRAEGEAYLSINSLGYRDREHDRAKPENTFRVAVLGDLFAEARQVPLEQTFWHRLGDHLAACDFASGKKIEMLNFGTGGYNTSQEYLTLQKDVLAFSPDIVLLTLFAGNDIEANWRKPKEEGVWRIRAPTYRIEDGELVMDSDLRPSPLQRLLYQAVHYSRLIELANEARRRIRARTWRSSEPNEIEAGLDASVFMPPATTQWHEAWLVTEALLASMNTIARDRGAQFMVVTVPSATEVDPMRERRRQTELRLGIDDFFYPDRKIAEMGTRLGFQVFPLTKELQEIAERREVYMHGFKNTRVGFGHLNEQGHRFVAEVLANKLCPLPVALHNVSHEFR